MLIWTSPPSAIIFASKAKGVKDGRKDSIKYTLIDMRKVVVPVPHNGSWPIVSTH
jgi:hypothetical protein